MISPAANIAKHAPRVGEIVEAAFARGEDHGKAALRAALWSLLLTQVTHFPQGNLPLVTDLAKKSCMRVIADLMEMYESEAWLKETFDPVSDMFLRDISDAVNTFRTSRGH